MKHLHFTLILVGLLAVISGCAGHSGDVSGTPQGGNHPSESAVKSPSARKNGNPSFGQTYNYKNGLSVTLSVPTEFTPSDPASIDPPSPSYVAFTVTVVNKTKENFDPVLFTTTLQSGNAEAEEVFDVADGFGDIPTTKVLPGRELTFKIGYGVKAPKDLVLQVSPGLEYDDVIFVR